MAQLVDRVRQVRHLKAKKAKLSKYHKKEKVSNSKIDEIEKLYDIDSDLIEEKEVNVAELKTESPYVFKLLKPSHWKNPIKPKNENFVTKSYMFDVIKCDEIFDLLDGKL